MGTTNPKATIQQGALPSGGTSGQVLVKNSGTDGDAGWGSATGTGNVVGPASAVDGEIALYNGTTGKTLKRGVAPSALPVSTAQQVAIDAKVQDSMEASASVAPSVNAVAAAIAAVGGGGGGNPTRVAASTVIDLTRTGAGTATPLTAGTQIELNADITLTVAAGAVEGAYWEADYLSGGTGVINPPTTYPGMPAGASVVVKGDTLTPESGRKYRVAAFIASGDLVIVTTKLGLVSGGGGTLSATLVTRVSPVDLTSGGWSDYKRYGQVNDVSTDIRKKVPGSVTIGALGLTNMARGTGNVGGVNLVWSDGYNDYTSADSSSAGSDEIGGWQIVSSGSPARMYWDVAVGTAEITIELDIYPFIDSGYGLNGTGYLELTLSDGSATFTPVVVPNTNGVSPGAGIEVYQIRAKAGSAGQTVRVGFRNDAGDNPVWVCGRIAAKLS